MESAPSANPPRNGEGDRPAQRDGGGGPTILQEPIKTVKRARKLRKEMSLPEVLLWIELQKRPGGYKFRKQFPQAKLVIDFACLSARLAIELDGEEHNRGDQPKFDERRDERLTELGFEVMRIPARAVLRNMDGVIRGVVARCHERGPLHHPPAADGPPPRSGEGSL